MKKIITALCLLLTICLTVQAQTVSIKSSGVPVVIDGKLYGEYKEADGGTMLTIKNYAQIKDGKLTLAKQTNSDYGLRKVEVCTIDITKMHDLFVPDAAETSSKYQGTVYSALVQFKEKAYEYNQKDYNGDGKMSFDRNWNYYLFINSESKENIAALAKAIKQGSFDDITFASAEGSENVATNTKPSATTASNTKATKAKKDVSVKLHNERRNGKVELVFKSPGRATNTSLSHSTRATYRIPIGAVVYVDGAPVLTITAAMDETTQVIAK